MYANSSSACTGRELTVTDHSGIFVVGAVVHAKLAVLAEGESRLISEAGDLVKEDRLAEVAAAKTASIQSKEGSDKT